MNQAPWIFSSIAVLSLAAAYGCGNGATAASTTGTGGGTHATSSTHAAGSSSSSGGTGGSVPAVLCNPFTGAPCKLAVGESCDKTTGGKFICFGPPNDVALCGTCDDTNTFCKVGTTCVGATGSGECAAFCCTDADCGAGGACHLKMGETVGVCLATADAGPDAGPPKASCSSPAVPPSNGSCYMP